jgi:hypothetical protein
VLERLHGFLRFIALLADNIRVALSMFRQNANQQDYEPAHEPEPKLLTISRVHKEQEPIPYTLKEIWI